MVIYKAFHLHLRHFGHSAISDRLHSSSIMTIQYYLAEPAPGMSANYEYLGQTLFGTEFHLKIEMDI